MATYATSILAEAEGHIRGRPAIAQDGHENKIRTIEPFPKTEVSEQLYKVISKN